jgi:MEKHLA domain
LLTDMNLDTPWLDPDWQCRIQWLLNSYRRWVGTELIDRAGTVEEQARRVFEAPFVVVSHGTQADPILNSANAIALQLWELPLDRFLQTPSRQTAEPVHRDERARMLEATSRQGYIDDYQGIRISATGRRFHIARATVWNMIDEHGQPVGQAATFDEWVYVE